MTYQIFYQMAIFAPVSTFEANLPSENVINSVTMILWLERGNLRDQFINGNTKSPQINSLVITSTHKHLRSPVIRSSSQGQHLLVCAPFYKLTTYSEIYQNAPFVQFVIENVVWLYVSMADVLVVDVFESQDNFVYYPLELLRYCTFTY